MKAAGRAAMPKPVPLRGYYHHHTRPSNGQPIEAFWNSSWRVPLPERCSSWTAQLASAAHAARGAYQRGWPLSRSARCFTNAQRASPVPSSPLMLAISPVQLGVALAGLDVGVLVRLRSGRCCYADPPTGPTGGRPRRQGAKFVCDDPTTWPPPTREWSATDAEYGRVQIQCWSGLHAIPQIHEKRGTRQARPIVRGPLIRLKVERLPKPTKVPLPLWLWWWGPEPPDLETVWRI
jgi:hypothetical protein